MRPRLEIRRLEQQLRGGVEALAVLRIEPRQLGAIEIEDAFELPMRNHGDDDLRARRRVAGYVARKCVYIRNDERLAALGGSATDTAAQGNPNTGDLALEGAEYELVSPQEIESGPVQIRQRREQERGHIGGVRNTIALTGKQRGQLSQQFAVGIRFGDGG